MANNYMVLNKDNVRESLTDTEIDILNALNNKVMEGRERKKFIMIEPDECYDALKLMCAIPQWKGVINMEELAGILNEVKNDENSY